MSIQHNRRLIACTLFVLLFLSSIACDGGNARQLKSFSTGAIDAVDVGVSVVKNGRDALEKLRDIRATSSQLLNSIKPTLATTKANVESAKNQLQKVEYVTDDDKVEEVTNKAIDTIEMTIPTLEKELNSIGKSINKLDARKSVIFDRGMYWISIARKSARSLKDKEDKAVALAKVDAEEKVLREEAKKVSNVLEQVTIIHNQGTELRKKLQVDDALAHVREQTEKIDVLKAQSESLLDDVQALAEQVNESFDKD